MRFLKQLIEKKMSNETVLGKNFQDELSYNEHVSAYLLSLSYLGLNDPNLHKKIYLWNRYIRTMNKNYFLKLLNYKPDEDYIILQAIKSMDIAQQESSENFSSLFSEFTWAIISFQHEQS